MEIDNKYNEPSVEDVTWQYLPAAGIGGKLAGKVFPYLPYIQDIWQGRNLLFHKPFNQMSKEEIKSYGKLGENFYQKFLQNNPVNIKNYGEVNFGSKNKGKDKTINMEQYPFLRKNLENAEYKYSSNYKNEPDRVYDYFENTHKNNLFEYLIENIKDRGFRYKMMHNKTNGE